MLNNPFKHPTVKIFILVIMSFASVLSYGQDPQKAKMSPAGMGYLEYLPAGYSTSTAKYPAIIFLHGSGERGTGTPTDLEKVKNQGPPKLIKAGEKMCFTVNGKTECFIVLSPQTNKWIWKYDVIPFIKYALQTYRIDPDRVCVTGLSMGGEGTWLTAGLEDDSPNVLAAIGVMCGRGSELNGITVASRKINVWAFHGDADTSLGIGGGLLPITGMLSVGANPAPIWTVYPGVGHGGCWDRGYRTDHTYHNPNLYEWFLTKRRPGSTSSAPAPSKPPVVNAGADKVLTLPSSTTSLYSTASDPDGQITSYNWTKVSGPSGTSLWNPTTKSLSVSGLVAGTYVFRITVKDNSNLQATDDVTVTVNAATNKPPTVEAGEKKYITLPVNSSSFTAVAKDTDGSIASYTWTRIGGGAITMSGTTTSTLKVSGGVAGTYVFRVVVKDNKGATASDTVRLKVNSAVASITKPATMDAIARATVIHPVNSALAATSSSEDRRIKRNDSSTKTGEGLIARNVLEDAYISRRSARSTNVL